MKNKIRWYSILLVGLVFILALSPISCGRPNHLENAEDYLEGALRAAGDLRTLLESHQYKPDYPEVVITKDYDEILQTIDGSLGIIKMFINLIIISELE